MIFCAVLRCAISQMYHLAVSSPQQCPSSNIYKRPGSQNTDKTPVLFAQLILTPLLCIAPLFSVNMFMREVQCLKSKELTFLRMFVCIGVRVWAHSQNHFLLAFLGFFW